MKKRMLSIIYGVLLACGISLAQTTMAACQGYCADRLPGADGLGDYEFDGCELTKRLSEPAPSALLRVWVTMSLMDVSLRLTRTIV
ncbi:MAG: hypothetical protein D6723_04525 [Acidobacteria bacterium]|nr:MAG: hypothetical protein D6723_04525 [Acidobacteriota bacterium]